MAWRGEQIRVRGGLMAFLGNVSRGDLTGRYRGGLRRKDDRQGIVWLNSLRPDRVLTFGSQLGRLFSLPSRLFVCSVTLRFSVFLAFLVSCIHPLASFSFPSFFPPASPTCRLLFLFADTEHNTHNQRPIVRITERDRPARDVTAADIRGMVQLLACMQPSKPTSHQNPQEGRGRLGSCRLGIGPWRPGVAVANQTCGPEHVQDRGREHLLAIEGAREQARRGHPAVPAPNKANRDLVDQFFSDCGSWGTPEIGNRPAVPLVVPGRPHSFPVGLQLEGCH
ncbi:hypothetical protein B0I37DRAFT_188374 [Chaetomium sp. MPI-CAGE-AT-0009]|nr:hypothetical protein B0I37DRAFT_188374 [Chaetomium sp. MPI-CAGE-AT-0009]